MRLLVLCLVLCLPLLAPAGTAAERVGVYDSRSVAIAYAGSPFMARVMTDLKDRHRRAKESGDGAAAARLEAEGKALQRKLHSQGFGTAPVDDLLAYIADRLPALMAEVGVGAIVSVWDEAGLARHTGAGRVDVTDALVEAFAPDERARRSAREIRNKPPARRAAPP